VAEAGSGRYLVYLKARVGNDKTAALHVLTASGADKRLATVGTRWNISLSGSTLFAAEPGSQHADVWLLPSVKAHPVTAPEGTEPMSAAPRGYLVGSDQRTPHEPITIEYVPLHGNVRSLGAPFPDGDGLAIAVGSKVFMAYVSLSDGTTGGVKSARFDASNRFHTLVGPGTRAASCSAPGTHYTACDETYAPQIRLFNVHGGQLATTSRRCPTLLPYPVVSGKNVLWLSCTNQRLYELHASGGVTKSKETFSDQTPVHALHRVVVSNRSRTELLTLTSATASPRVLLKAS
jgi:hypothetical protein